MRIHLLQHVPFEGPGIIESWADVNGCSFERTELYADGVEWPGTSDFDCLVVMGGPMGVQDEKKYPWMTGEKKFIEKSIRAGKAVLGICLGAQLIADVLGARVRRNQHTEIGWGPVTLTEEGLESGLFNHVPRQMPVFHWHGDTFDIPKGGRRLAGNRACHNQAFLFRDRVLGLQYHLEVRREDVMAIIEHCDDELTPGPHVQTPPQMLGQKNAYTRANHVLRGILLKFSNIDDFWLDGGAA